MSAPWNNPPAGLPRGLRVIAGACALAMGSALWANPVGVEVTHGEAAFSQPDANTLDIANTPGAILNWQQFSIQAGETTRFIQQSADSAVLNRVVGQDPSSLLGQLLSNGRVYLINRNGIVFGPDAVIDTAGFVASTLGLSDADFLAGRHEFKDGGEGDIRNQGYIKAGDDGDIFLIAPNIENSGIIETRGGQLILAAGERVTLVSLDSEHIVYELEAPDNAVLNLGGLLTRGGAAAIFAGSIRQQGVVNADSIRLDEQGRIELYASKDIVIGADATLSANGPEGGAIRITSRNGETRITGAIEATGSEAAGGQVIVEGDEVRLQSGAVIDVSGALGGGEALVGGDFQGANTGVQNARNTTVESGATIRADAVENGDGGKVIVWSDENTAFAGTIAARGAGEGGDGGFAEISGKDALSYRGRLDLGAALGNPGSVLFDPKFIFVANLGGPGLSLALPVSGNDDFSENSGLTVTFDADDITAITDTGVAVDLRANTDVSIDEPLVTNNTGGAGGDLGIHAGRSVHINADIHTDDGELVIVANDPGASTGDRDPGLAGIFMADGTTLNAGANNLTLEIGNLGQSGDMVLENVIGNDMLFRINGLGDGITGSSVLRASNDALISGNSLFIDHNPLGISSGGSVGALIEPLLIQLNNVAAHTHASSPGIFMDSPLQGVTVGGTYFGGFHLIQGLETVAGGDIDLDVNGTLTTAAGPLACGGSGGTICAGAGGDITLSADDVILNTVVDATAGDVTIRPLNLFQNILIGGAGGLNLSPAELQMINANGVLLIGRTDGTGTLTLATPVSSTDINATTLSLAHGSILINNNIDFSAGNEGLALKSPGFIQIINNSGAPFTQLTIDLGSGDLVIDGLGAGGLQLQGGMLDNTGTFVIADTITAGNLDFLNVSGGSGLGSFATLNSDGLMDLAVINDLTITAYGVFTDSFAQLSSSGGQNIQAGYIEINSGPESISPAATGIFNQVGGAQVITTTGQNPSNEGLVLMGTGEAVIKCTSGCASQAITVNNADFVRLDAQPGSQFTQIFSDATQAITLQGTGLNTLQVGSAGSQGWVEIVSIGSQTIKAGQSGESGSITVQAGSTNNPSLIQSSGSQTITVQDDFMVIGGASGAGGALAEIFAFGGSQTIDAGNLLIIQGGSSGTGNDAKVNGNLGATITATDIQVMGGDGGRALIDTIGAAQVITAANSILVQGANGGDGNGGEIIADLEQTITAGPGGITLTAGTGMEVGNPASITQLLPGFNQTLAAPGGTIHLTGGSDFGLALINGSGTTQTITADTLILEMPASGAANDSAARIDGNAQYITVANGLFIQNPNPNAVDTSTEIEGFGSIQDIDAGYIEIFNSSGTAAMIEQIGPGQQLISTTGQNGSGEGLVIEDDGAGANSFAGILCLGSGFGGACNKQEINIGNANVARIAAYNPASGRGAGIHAADSSAGIADQKVRLAGSGTNILFIGDSANGAVAAISADGPGQTIIIGDAGEAGTLYILGGGDDSSSSMIAAGFNSGNTAQTITVQDGIFIFGAAAPSGDQNTGIIAFGDQAVTAGATGIMLTGGSNTVSGGGNSATIGQLGGGFNQDISVNGGVLTLISGDGVDNNRALIKSLGSQNISATDVSLFGAGVGSLNNALIESASAQTISVINELLLFGVASGSDNDLLIHATGGLQDIDAGGGIQLMGGFGGSGNDVIIRGDLGAQISADYLSINGGMGMGNEATIETSNALQKITAADGILIQGGSVGSGGQAGILADSGMDISAGASGISLVGGAGAGAPGNPAVIEQQGPGSSLILTLNDGGDLNLTGGADGNFNFAAIRNLAGDIIIQNGTGSGVDLNLVGGAGAGSSNNFALIEATNPAGNNILIDIDGSLSVFGGSEPTGFNNFAEIISIAGDITGMFGGGGILYGGPGQEASADIDAEGLLDLDFGGSLELIGGDGQDASAGLGASTVLLDSGGLTITGGNGVDALAGIGIDDGPIVVVIGDSVPINGDVNLTGGSAAGAFAGIGTNCLSIGCNADVSVNAGGSFILQNGTAAAAIGNLGGDPGVIDITAAMLGAGDILLNDGLIFTNSPLYLTVASGTGSISQTSTGQIDIGSNVLTLTTQGGAIDLPSLNNSYGSVAVVSNGGPVNLIQAGNLVIDGMSTGAGLVTVIAAGSITQSGPILADYLSLQSDSFIDLLDPANAIAQFDAATTNPGGSIHLINSIPLVVNGVTTNDSDLDILNTGSLSIGVLNVGTGLVQLSAGGMISDANGGADNIIAGQLLVTNAGGGFGSLADPLEVQASNVFIDGVTTGDISLAITGGGPATLSGLNSTSSQPVLITSAGLLNLNVPISVAGNTGFQANGIVVSAPLVFGAGVDFDAGTGSLLIGSGGVTAGGPVTLKGSDILLNAPTTDINAGAFPVTINAAGAVTAPIGSVPDIIASNLSINAANGVDLLITATSLTVVNTTAGAVNVRNLGSTLTAAIANTGRPVTLENTGGNLTLGAIDGSIVNLQGNAIADGNGATLNINAATLFYTAPAGFGTATDPVETQVANLTISPSTTSGDIGIINNGDITLSASVATSGDINLTASGGTLLARNVTIGAHDIRFSGATVQIGHPTSGSTQITATNDMQVIDSGSLIVRGSDTIVEGSAKITAAGNVSLTNVGDVTIQGGNADYANAGIDPLEVIATITGDLVLQAGAGDSSEAQISATDLVDLEVGGIVSLSGGAGADAHAVINATDGEVVIHAGTATAPTDVILTTGAGANADAVILADSGTGTITIHAAVCTGCDELAANPLTDTSAQTGVFGDLFLNATPGGGEIIPGNEQVIVMNDIQDIFSGGDEEFLREMGILESDEDEDEDEERTLLECR